MDDLPVFDRLKEIMETIEQCLQVNRILPALILLYTLIDSISWLALEKPNVSVKKRFTSWVERWLLKSKSLSCTSLELYAARCAILHSLTSDSDLSASKKVRRIVYSSKDLSPSPLQVISDQLRPGELVAIRVEDFYDAFRTGLVNYLQDTMQDLNKRTYFEQRATRYFSCLDKETINSLSSKMDKK